MEVETVTSSLRGRDFGLKKLGVPPSYHLLEEPLFPYLPSYKSFSHHGAARWWRAECGSRKVSLPHLDKQQVLSSPHLFFFFFFFFFGPSPRHLLVSPREVSFGVHRFAYTTATATRDLSLFFNLHHSSGQYQISNPLNEPTFSWILVGLVSAVPQQELQVLSSFDDISINFFPLNFYSSHYDSS